jgi:hypothetical protein
MHKWIWILTPLIFMAIVNGCRENAESFFSGRPSGMAMAHNRVLDGSVESMVELLRIPQRFPDANESHKLNWQESAIAWWRSEAGHGVMLTALPKLTEQEIQSLENWVATRDKLTTQQKAATLDEIKVAISAARARGAGAGS